MTVLPPKVRPGLTGRAELVVGTNDTASRVGSGRVAVLATPVMIGVIEAAALDAVEPLLGAGKQSLGTHPAGPHAAATPVRMPPADTPAPISRGGPPPPLLHP